jgi:hypothetical protein
MSPVGLLAACAAVIMVILWLTGDMMQLGALVLVVIVVLAAARATK